MISHFIVSRSNNIVLKDNVRGFAKGPEREMAWVYLGRIIKICKYMTRPSDRYDKNRAMQRKTVGARAKLLLLLTLCIARQPN